jgi:hypothetical protein
MRNILKIITSNVAYHRICCTFVATVLALLPIRTACGSFYFKYFPSSFPLILNIL